MGRVNGFSWEYKGGCKEPLTWKSHTEQAHREPRRAFPCSLQALAVIPRRKLQHCAWKNCTLTHSQPSWPLQESNDSDAFQLYCQPSPFTLLISNSSCPAHSLTGLGTPDCSPCSIGSDLLLPSTFPSVWLAVGITQAEIESSVLQLLLEQISTCTLKGTHNSPCISPYPICISV